MKLKDIKNPTIIEGFPGFGLVGTISTEFLVEHLGTVKVGQIELDDIPAMVAVHDGKIISPIGIYYSKKHNVILVNAITLAKGSEWRLASEIVSLAEKTKAKEIISLEGVGNAQAISKPRVFCYSDKGINLKKLLKSGSEELKEGIVVGVTGALLTKETKSVKTAIFGETASALPDSKAAARVIEVLDKYLGLKVNPKPLIKQAEKFEEKLKTIISQAQQVSAETEKKQLNYVG